MIPLANGPIDVFEVDEDGGRRGRDVAGFDFREDSVGGDGVFGWGPVRFGTVVEDFVGAVDVEYVSYEGWDMVLFAESKEDPWRRRLSEICEER